jgi:MFS family permease
MEEKRISEQESLLIIQQMIHAAKAEQKDDGKGWILWGWLLFFASIFTYLNLKFNWVSTFFFWNVFGVITLLLISYEIARFYLFKRKEKVRTYTKDLFEKLNIGFFFSLMLIILSMNLGISPLKGFGLLLGLYGFWILIYGAVLNFKPSIIGAYITWAFAFATLFVNEFEWTMILHAAAVLCGYIIPGHIAYREFNKVNQEAKNISV